MKPPKANPETRGTVLTKMLFSEGDAPLLKKWIVKRLENTSDADADVLADYVLALLRHDGDIETVRQLCEAEIPDFLKEDSAIFVQDVFDAIQYKSYLPGAVPPRRSSIPSGPSALSYGNLGMGAPMGPQNGSRKRSYNDRGDGDPQDRGFQQGGDPNGRSYKQSRRGGPSMGRGNEHIFQGPGRGDFGTGRPPPMNIQSIQPQGFPSMPSPPPGMPTFDPNNPMAALLAMQAMSFPMPGVTVGNSPGLPQFPTPISPMGQGPPGTPMQLKRPRCKDYDIKGFCAKGNTCQYEHGEHSIWVPPAKKPDEYDPTKSTLMGGMDVETQLLDGGFSFRGRGRGRGGFQRGDGRGFNNPSRRGGRAEFSSDRPNYDKNNTTIVVEQIPEEKFSEDEVRGFFSEFGNIVEVTMRPYKRLAVVKFENWDSAHAAYHSPKVIFDNRFVKVYWFVNSESLPKAPVMGDAAAKNGTSTPAKSTSEPHINIEAFTKKQEEVQKAHEEKQKKLKDMEAARKELEKRQEDLLKSQAEEKRKLMEKLAVKRGNSGSPAVDLDTGTVQPESDHDKLKKQLAALEAEAQSLGIDTDSQVSDDTPYWLSGRGRGRGRGGYRGRGAFVPRGFRGGYRGRGATLFAAATGRSFNLDNRPKRVGLTGNDFSDPSKDEALREYLLGIGEYTDIEHNLAENRTTITFKERYTAEKFISSTTNGEIPGVGKVEMAWVQNQPPSFTTAHAKVERNGDDDLQMGDGDAMAATSSSAHGAGYMKQDQQENIDYDVADDNDYEVY